MSSGTALHFEMVFLSMTTTAETVFNITGMAAELPLLFP
jgi:hypothetical protein